MSASGVLAAHRVPAHCGRFVSGRYRRLLPVIVCQRTPHLIASVKTKTYKPEMLSGGRGRRFKSSHPDQLRTCHPSGQRAPPTSCFHSRLGPPVRPPQSFGLPCSTRPLLYCGTPLAGVLRDFSEIALLATRRTVVGRLSHTRLAASISRVRSGAE
jgi:hypothetical protein